MLFSVVYLCQYKCGPQYNPASPAIGWLTMRIIFLSLGFSLLCLIESRSVFETRDLRQTDFTFFVMYNFYCCFYKEILQKYMLERIRSL